MAKNPHLTQDKLDLLAQIPEDVIELISSGVKTQSDLQAMILGLKSRIIESALNGEMNHHLSNSRSSSEEDVPYNRRNGYSGKLVKTDSGDLSINIPRDRAAEFEPLLVQKYKRRLEGIDDAVLALYSRGMSMRDIRATLNDLYQQDLSEELISSITDSVNDEVKEWQNRPLESSYPILYLDCIVIKVQENKSIINKAVYLALGIRTDGVKGY
jgi:putative transposase